MTVWEADFYRRPLQDAAGHLLWELLICDPNGSLRYSAFCAQPQVSVDWVTLQLQQLVEAGNSLPEKIQVFRPQTLNLLEPACKSLGIAVEPNRHTLTLKEWLVVRSRDYPTLSTYNHQPYQPLDLDKPPPVPLPEQLWGDQWRFATLSAGNLEDVVAGRMIPILNLPPTFLPLHLGLASTVPIPGVVMDGGRQSLRLARWIQQARPVSLNAVSGAPDGLILEAGLVDRWVIATFEDSEVVLAARTFEQRKQASQGLHFLLIQPDDSGMTYSGFWLLKADEPGAG